MATSKKFSELPAASSVGNGDLFAIAHEDTLAETGYVSQKLTAAQAGQKVNGDTEYPTSLPSFPTGSQNPFDALEKLNADIDSLYPVNTASGSIANFTTSLVKPLVSGKFEIPYRKWGYSQMRIKNQSSYPDWNNIRSIVQQGLATQNFSIGEEIHTTWERNGITYDFPWVVMAFGTCFNSNDEEVPCMVLQARYSDPVGMPFSGYPALLHCPSGLAAGTYHFKCSANWGNISGNTDYQFTLTQDVPNNGLVCVHNNWPDVAVAYWKITTYASNTSATSIEQVALTAGNGGTDLGTFTPGYSSATMNGYQAAAYGYNRWSKSAIRQWLNSDAAAGAWWHPQTVWDMAPSKAATERGFLAGFTDDFKHVLHETKIKTALNTSDKTKEGVGFEYTYDKIFLPALEQMYINPQATGDDAEGAYWEYYKELNGTDTKFAQNGTYPELIKYDLTNHSTARPQRLRSANRGSSSGAWLVNTSGSVTGYGAVHALQCAPACIIH